MARPKAPTTQVMDHFKTLYKEKYGVDYKVSNYPKEYKLIKTKLLEEFTLEESLKIVELMVKHYEEWNRNKDFKIGVHSFTSTTWLRDKAVEKMREKETQKSQMTVDVVKHQEKTKTALSRILERAKNKGGK